MSINNSPKIEVVAAIISNNSDEILCMQRGKNKHSYISKKYEFPGGKIEKGETNEYALIREINEEINIKILVVILEQGIIHFAPYLLLIKKMKILQILSNIKISF